jgi:hypothetical protein
VARKPLSGRRDAHFKGITTKEWTKREYEAKIIKVKGKLEALDVLGKKAI